MRKRHSSQYFTTNLKTEHETSAGFSPADLKKKKTLVATQNDNRPTGGIELRNINKNLRIETYKNGRRRRRRSRRRNVHERLLCEEEYQPNLISDQCIVQNTQNTGCGNRKDI